MRSFALAAALLAALIMVGAGCAGKKGAATDKDTEVEVTAKAADGADNEADGTLSDMFGSPSEGEGEGVPAAGGLSTPTTDSLLNPGMPGEKPAGRAGGGSADRPRPQGGPGQDGGRRDGRGPGGPGGGGPQPEVVKDTQAALKRVNMPLYPGAKTEEGMLVSMPGSKDDANALPLVRLSTGDSFDKVLNWYKGKLSNARVQQGDDPKRKQAVLMSVNEKTREAQVAELVVDEGRTQVVLSRRKLPPPPKVNRDKNAAAKRVQLPLYPGATVQEGATMSAPNDANSFQTVVALTTADAPDKVVAWYKKEMKPDDVREQKVEGTTVTEMVKKGSSQGSGASVVVGKKDGKTVINLMRMRLAPQRG